MIIVDVRDSLHEDLLDFLFAAVPKIEILHGVIIVEGGVKPLMVLVLHSDLALSDCLCDNGGSLNCPDEWAALDDYLLKSMLLHVALQKMACFLDLSHAQWG